MKGECITMFEPIMKARVRLEYSYYATFDNSEIEMFKELAEYILQNAVVTLAEQIKNKGKDYIIISLSLDDVRQQFQCDYSKYNPMGVKRELKNLASEENLELYQIDEEHVYITF